VERAIGTPLLREVMMRGRGGEAGIHAALAGCQCDAAGGVGFPVPLGPKASWRIIDYCAAWQLHASRAKNS
jgi:hypothetical protein